MKCDDVRKKFGSTSLRFNLGPKDNLDEQVNIHIYLESYLVHGPYLGASEDTCFLPIFVISPGSDSLLAKTWFLGNMFMDRYFIINDYDHA